MRIGLALPHYDSSLAGGPATWDGVLATARAAEAAGFDSVWVSDHLFLDWGKYGGPESVVGSLESWTTLAALAAATSRVRLGTLTLCNDLRNPALVAKMAAALDQLSDGRLELGMGAGWYEPEYRAAGISFDPPGVRIRRLAESIEIVARLLEGEELTFRGDHYTTAGAVCRPGPHQQPRPSIWVGGKGDFLLRTAARSADGWNLSWLGSTDIYKERAAVMTRACETAGRDPATLRRSVGALVLAGADEADARRRFERLATRTPPGVMAARLGGAGVSWEGFRQAAFAGPAGEVAERLAPLADMGVEEIVVSVGILPFQVGDLEDVEVIGSAVAPALR